MPLLTTGVFRYAQSTGRELILDRLIPCSQFKVPPNRSAMQLHWKTSGQKRFINMWDMSQVVYLSMPSLWTLKVYHTTHWSTPEPSWHAPWSNHKWKSLKDSPSWPNSGNVLLVGRGSPMTTQSSSQRETRLTQTTPSLILWRATMHSQKVRISNQCLSFTSSAAHSRPIVTPWVLSLQPSPMEVLIL